MIHTPKNHWSGILQSLSSDIILWHLLTKRSDHSVFCINLGSHHVPHSGDIPNTLQHTNASSIILVPFNFHDRGVIQGSSQEMWIDFTRITSRMIWHWSRWVINKTYKGDRAMEICELTIAAKRCGTKPFFVWHRRATSPRISLYQRHVVYVIIVIRLLVTYWTLYEAAQWSRQTTKWMNSALAFMIGSDEVRILLWYIYTYFEVTPSGWSQHLPDHRSHTSASSQ
jgi:hypothetical protein